MAQPIRLAVAPTPLIGRVRERAAVADMLARDEVRLLTLTGAGGVGKTRLALSVAADVASSFADGVSFVDLGAVADPALVPSAIARVLAVNESAQRPLVEGLVEYLSGRSLLLVLDNVEQLLPAAPVVAGLLAACPDLKIVTTSRSPLRLSGEHEFPVPPLALPHPGQQTDVATVSAYEAVTLFTQRARAVRPDFAVTAANASAVAELCVRLDGLPLAIELAAARIKLLSPQALLARLEHRLGILTGGAQDLPARQRTLRKTMDWSYELLEPAERVLFAQLAAFAGGCSLDAAEAVAAPHAEPALDLLEGLAQLVDKSLLRRLDGTDDEPRFAMLETIREYAVERLQAREDVQRVRGRHAAYFRALAERAAPELAGRHQGPWLEQLERDHDNLRAALDWAIEHDEQDVGLRLAAALGAFWEMRGHLSEGQGRLERVLSRWPEAQSRARADALNAAGKLAYLRGELRHSARLHEESLRLQRLLSDQRGEALSLHNLGSVAHYLGEFERASALYEESLAINRTLGDRRGIALTLNGAGVLARNRGRHDDARTLYLESLGIFRELGDTWGVALLLNNLARVERDLEDWERATDLCKESLSLFTGLGDQHGIAWVLSNQVVIAHRRGASERAARLHGATERLREAIGSTALSLSPAERAAYDAAVAATRQILGAEVFAAAVAAGRALPPEQVAIEHLADAPAPESTPAAAVSDPPPSADLPANPLTRREREVAALVAQGHTDRQIAQALVITEGTVGAHLTNIYTKLDLHTRAQLAAWAVGHGLRRDTLRS